MSDDFTAVMQGQRLIRQERGQERRNEAARTFEAVAAMAARHGLKLVRHSDQHYQLKAPGYMVNIYPGNLRLHWPGNRPKGPFLDLPDEWTLFDVVCAAIDAKGGAQ